MKKLVLAIMLTITLTTFPVGCGHQVSTTTPIAPAIGAGYKNPADQQMGEILAGAHGFYNSIQQQVAAGTLVLQPQVKTAFNSFGVTLNSAQMVYVSYHAGAATQAQAQAQVDQVKQQQAALPLPGAK